MLKVSWKYIAFLSVLLALYFILLYFMPQRFNWFVTLYEKDKDPFGAFVFKTLIDNSWIPEVNTSNQTLFELQDLEVPNLLILCEELSLSPSEIDAFLARVHDGKTVLIAAHQLDTVLMNTLPVKMNTQSFHFYLDKLWGADSLGVQFTNAAFDTSRIFWLPEQMLPQYFEDFDSSGAEVLAENTRGEPVLLQMKYGNGYILISSTPLFFTNFSMLRSGNDDFVAGILSYLQPGSLHWTEYYQMGRMEATTPLRYVLSEPSLKWALYILMVTILLMMFFDMKREQRIIPVISPLKNETADFVKTVARLYYQKKDHRNLAAKKILHFTDYLKQQLYVDVNDEMSEIIEKVAAKTGSEEQDVKVLFDQIAFISNASYISAKELKLFFDRIQNITKE